jgi:hypothetical protein
VARPSLGVAELLQNPHSHLLPDRAFSDFQLVIASTVAAGSAESAILAGLDELAVADEVFRSFSGEKNRYALLGVGGLEGASNKGLTNVLDSSDDNISLSVHGKKIP